MGVGLIGLPPGSSQGKYSSGSLVSFFRTGPDSAIFLKMADNAPIYEVTLFF